MRPRSRSLVAAVLAFALAACGGGGEADIGLGERPRLTSTTVAGQGTTVPGQTPAPVPTPSVPVPTAAPGPGPTSAPGPAPGPGPAPTSPPGPNPGRVPGLASIQLKLTRVANFSEPWAMAVRRGDGALYVAEKRGRVRAFRGSSVDPAAVLDISGEVSTGTEQGLLGLTFSPDGSRLYVNYTDTEGDTHVVEYAMRGGQANPETRRELLFIDQPAANNNGGQLAFGPDGRLWIGVGDGGGGGDPQDNAQRLSTLLGKLLRIDPQPGIDAPYRIPEDNPFVSTSGARPEIWAYGLRNPRRFSFDRATGDLWIADVGQNAREEIDFQPSRAGGGQNYGWARLEGGKAYSGAAPANHVPPIYDYERVAGACGITGGYVYRGNRIRGLVGAYVFGDFCVGQVTAIRQLGGQVTDQRAYPGSIRPLTGFGEDGAGELYALSLEGGLFRIDPA